jgi:predicted Zn-dependent protease
MKVIVTLFLAILSLSQGYAYAQSEEVKSCLKMISDGKVDDVKRKLPDLLAEYPDDPGVMLVHASVLDDAYRANGLLEKLIKRYPDSQWTDNAYWRVIQFYAVAGDTTKAKQELEGYRQKYPSSPYLLAASDVVRTSVMLARSDSQLENTI